MMRRKMDEDEERQNPLDLDVAIKTPQLQFN
jgi:hypothetical protein